MTTSTSEFRRIFVDTSAWLALSVRADQYHGSAARFEAAVGQRVERVTSWGVISETYTWLRYHLGHRDATRWLQEAIGRQRQGVLEVRYPSAGSEASVSRLLARFADQTLSYVDAFSLYLVDQHGDIDAIFAFDHHLALTGVPVVPNAMSPRPTIAAVHAVGGET